MEINLTGIFAYIALVIPIIALWVGFTLGENSFKRYLSLKAEGNGSKAFPIKNEWYVIDKESKSVDKPVETVDKPKEQYNPSFGDPDVISYLDKEYARSEK